MLRELSQTLLDLHDGFERMAAEAAHAATAAGSAKLRLTGVELTLPIDLRMAFADGGCQLFGDVPRSRADTGFNTPSSRLAIVWEQHPVVEQVGGSA